MELRLTSSCALILPLLALCTLSSVSANTLVPGLDQHVLADILDQKPMHTTALLAGAAMAPTTPTPIGQSRKASITRAASGRQRGRPSNAKHKILDEKTEEGEDGEMLHMMELR
ncbi:MAG: hypothetical protein Q9164_007786 [Protoblastenia rupestris]